MPLEDPHAQPEPDADPWLDEQQQEAWLAIVGLVTYLPAAIDRDLQRTAGLTMYEYVVMALLSESEEHRLQMSELAAGTNASLSRLSHVVSRLERRGWIVRQTSPDDGRATRAVLTDAGMAEVVAAAPGHVRTVRSLVIDPLTPGQLRQLGAAAAKIVQRIDERDSAPPAADA